jgi:carboxymethylproline synthase
MSKNFKFEMREGGVGIVTFCHEKAQNPFSRALTRELIDSKDNWNNDDSIRSIVITGGEDRSFSVGGDFRDVSALKERDEIAEYLLEIIDLYVALLAIEKPVVMGVDHFAIGQGLQVALMGDWRVATSRSQYSMPELKNGVACPLGSAILEHFFGRSLMLDWVIGCAGFDADKAYEHKLVNEVVEPSNLLSHCYEKALEFANFPSVPYKLTKNIQNGRFIKVLNDIREPAAHAHVESFLVKAGKKHFDNILKQDT